MPGWDDATQAWRGWDVLGPEPSGWTGPFGGLEPEEGLHVFQRVRVPVVSVGGRRLLAGPRPPFFAWHGHPGHTGQPRLSGDARRIAGSGIYLAQHQEAARRDAGSGGEVLAFGIGSMPGGMSGWDLLFRLNHLHGSGSGITCFLRGLGFAGVAYGATSRGEGGWCVFDPRVFQRLMRTDGWSFEEIRQREALDPEPPPHAVSHVDISC